MANDYRDRPRFGYRGDYERDRFERDEQNRGMFGYEGEGYMRGGGRDLDRMDRERDFGYDRGWDRGPYRGEYQSFRGRGPKNYQRSDERIREDVCELLAEDDYIDASDIEVTVSEGTVTLLGMVDDRGTKRRAEDVVESVSGVRDVQNQLRVGRNHP